jgi:hypothetical protein
MDKLRRMWACIGLALGVQLLAPVPAYACDSWICLGDILGLEEAGEQVTLLGERDAERRETEARIKVDADTSIANIQAWQASQADSNATIRAQADAMARVMIAQAVADRDVRLTEISALYLAQQTALQNQRDVILAGLAQQSDNISASGLWLDILGAASVALILAVVMLSSTHKPQVPSNWAPAPPRIVEGDSCPIERVKRGEIVDR